MTWSFHYGDRQLGEGLSLKDIDLISEQLLACLAQARVNDQGVVWFKLQHDNGQGGIAEERLLVGPGIPMAFYEE